MVFTYEQIKNSWNIVRHEGNIFQKYKEVCFGHLSIISRQYQMRTFSVGIPKNMNSPFNTYAHSVSFEQLDINYCLLLFGEMLDIDP